MKRLSYIDRVKGLLIISVVLGHAAMSIGLMDYNYPIVYSLWGRCARLSLMVFMVFECALPFPTYLLDGCTFCS